MQGRRIVFRAKVDERRTEGDAIGHASPFKRRKVEGEVIFVLEKQEGTATSPAVLDVSAYKEDHHRTVGQRRAKAIPEKFEKCETLEDLQGEVYAPITESRSAPSTPLVKTKSSDKIKGEHEDRSKHDAFDGAVDALLITGLELKEMTKGFLPERDSAKLEGKLQEYISQLAHLEEMTKTQTERDRQLVDAESWKAVEGGMHPDVHLMERSDELMQCAKRNVEDAKIIDRLLEIGRRLPKPTGS